MLKSDEHTEVRAMSKTELAALYGVCLRTLNKWLKPFIAEIEPIDGTRIFTVAQVKMIFEKIGTP